MTRRTGLLAVFTMVATPAQWTSFVRTKTYRVILGGDDGFETFEFTDGVDTVTFTAKELMAALKDSR